MVSDFRSSQTDTSTFFIYLKDHYPKLEHNQAGIGTRKDRIDKLA